jgi:hypothetical protein
MADALLPFFHDILIVPIYIKNGNIIFIVGELSMKKYSGIVSIFILVLTFAVLQALVGKQIGHLWIWIIAAGYAASAAASWYSESGFWRKASATILIALPIGFLTVVITFIFALRGNDF